LLLSLNSFFRIMGRLDTSLNWFKLVNQTCHFEMVLIAKSFIINDLAFICQP